MQESSTFQVYNASAGSGKTFILVKEYLKILLNSSDIFTFQKVLAITFTNKAAGEMKERVLSSLQDFSEGKDTDLLKIILNEISVDKIIIQARSKKILEAILQNYSAFSITTIDSFTYKIIKNFAYDLGLSLNFEVEMDTQSLLNEAVDVLISKIGTDKKLTEILVDYSLDKTDNDASWDITNDLNDFANILLNEDDIQHFKNLTDKTLDDFSSLKSKLFSHQNELQKAFEKIGNDCLALIEKKGLEPANFFKSTIPNFFRDLVFQSFDINFLSRSETIDKAFASNQFYINKTPGNITSIIDQIAPEIRLFHEASKEIYSQYSLNKLALKSIIPLAVLNHINSELENIKIQNNIRLNAEFNQLISDKIKDQPAPFIYERIGQRFQNYFIDEMQDTSILQWQNLIPLIDNTLSQEHGSLLLVGDGKQSIYRFRGGKAAQFINLGAENNNPFQVEKSLFTLETNFRSFSEIINFNNSFFTHLANFFANESYKKLFFEGNSQLENSKKGGFVAVSFIDKEIEDEEIEEEHNEKSTYPKRVLKKIIDINEHFLLSEICVLTRKKKESVEIANYLTQNNISIISSESLLLKNNEKVIFIINILKMFQNQEDEDARFEFLYFLFQHLQIKTSKHDFFERFSKMNNQLIFKLFKEFEVFFDEIGFQQLPFYEKIEQIIRSFSLVNSSDAYIQYFLDIILEQQNKGKDLIDFLEFWELKKESLSIVAPEISNAVQIMTIHKSKGLEFPVVIFPCDVRIYEQIKPKVWLDELPQNYQPFSELLIDYNSQLQLINNRALEIFEQQSEELELDNFNLLYVALTRAVEQLHIITGDKLPKTEKEKPTVFSEIFKNYLKQINLWEEGLFEYSFGEQKRMSIQKNTDLKSEIHQKFISIPWKEHELILLASASKLWDTAQGKAIDFGNLIHEILSKIISFKDVENVLNRYFKEGYVSEIEKETIKKTINSIVFHPTLHEYFSEDVIVFNEREIIDSEKQIIIPDRLVFKNNNELVIIDYKTGNQLFEHQQQLSKYENVLKTMNFKVYEKLLIYIGYTIEVVKVY